MSEYYIKTKTKHLPQIILYPRHYKMCMWKNEALRFSMTNLKMSS